MVQVCDVFVVASQNLSRTELARELTEDVKLGNYFVGKGTAVMVSIHLMHHNSKFWKKVGSF